MCDQFSRKALKVAVALICQTIGWNSIMSTPLEILIDLLQRYLVEMGRVTHRYAELFGHTQPNLDDLGLAFREMGVNLQDMEEYIKNVESVPCHGEIPKFPVPREPHLNFLKPGSREVVTRPVHVHEHLPPMYPEMEEEESSLKKSPLSVDTSNNLGSTSPLSSPKSNVFKRPGDPVSLENPVSKRLRMLMEEEGRPLREISSVMMTTSGFLSPAREGKLPESRTPLQPSDSRSNSPQPSSYPMVPPEVKGEKKSKKATQKKIADAVKKTDKENKKEHRMKEHSKSSKIHTGDETKVKKLVSMKELSKLKALKSGAVKMSHNLHLAGPSSSGRLGKLPTSKMAGTKASISDTHKAARHALKASKLEKSHTSVSHMTQPKLTSPEKHKEPLIEGKLSTEPDKQKLNIFKKISKVKEDRTDRSERIVDRTESVDSLMRDSRESSPRLVIDESEINSRQREARMAQIDDCIDAVIQQSMEIADDNHDGDDENNVDGKVLSGGDESVKQSGISGVGSQQHKSDELYMYDDDLSPPGTPSSTPKTPELPTPSRKSEKSEMKEKKKKKEKSKSKKDSKSRSHKGFHSPKKQKIEVIDLEDSDKPKTPEAAEPREVIPTPVFPFFPHFPPTPGLIPPPLGHPLFPRFPLPLGKNLPHPAMPNLPLPPPLFMQPRTEDPQDEKPKTSDKAASSSSQTTHVKADSPEKVQISSHIIKKTLEKKVKEHRKERRDKAKRKKEKKLKAKKEKERKKIKLEKKERLKEKLKEKKEKKEKRKEKELQLAHGSSLKDSPTASLSAPSSSHVQKEEKSEKSDSNVPKITFKLGSGSSCPPSPENPPKKMSIKSFGKDQDDEEEEDTEREQQSSSAEAPAKREPSPELARISALITRPPKTKPSKSHPEKCGDSESPLECGSKPAVCGQPTPAVKMAASGSVQDNDGNKVWICPACGGQDDGSPMIGCDDCDAWYHWVCVGIQVPPDENEDWYCRVCIVRKQENIVDKKKKSKKKKTSP